MQLKCLGSSSSGNCYLLENKEECLVLEAGIPFKEVKKALDFNITKIVGVVVSHSHGDHAKYCDEYPKAGIPIFKAYKIMIPNLEFGNFLIRPFKLEHDVECYGFYIMHQDMGRLVFATDTYYVKYHFSNVNHIMIECNYSQKIIDNRNNQGETVNALRDRVLQSHMELETCKDFVRANTTSDLHTVTLMHLSDGNSDERLFSEEINNIVAGAGTKVYVANKGVTIDLYSLPFH